MKAGRRKARKRTGKKIRKASPQRAKRRPELSGNTEMRAKDRLACLYAQIRSGGGNPGEIAGWDEAETEHWYGLLCESRLQARSLPLAAISIEFLWTNLPEREGPSCSVRGVMYMALSAGWLPSSESYGRIQELLVKLRRCGILPYEWIADEARATIKPSSWAGMQEYADVCRESYRKDFWAEIPFYLEVIVEKQTLANLLEPVTSEYDLPLEPLRGFSSDTFLHSIGSLWRRIDKPIIVLFMSDFDPSGIAIEKDAKEKLCLHSGGEIGPDLTWTRLAVNPEHFDEFKITSLGFKPKDSRKNKFIEQYGERCCECEAIPPKELRRILRDEIERLIPQEKWRMLQRIEAAEKESSDRVMDVMRNGAIAAEGIEFMRPADDDDQAE